LLGKNVFSFDNPGQCPYQCTTIELRAAGNRKADHTPTGVFARGDAASGRPVEREVLEEKRTKDLRGWIRGNIARTACGERGTRGAGSGAEAEEIHLANMRKQAWAR
jgi:hypothetical protein